MNPARMNYGFHNKHDMGYGRMGVELGRALEGLGVECLDSVGHASLDINREEHGLTREAEVLAPVALWSSTPPHVRGWHEGQFAAILTMWEASEIPAGFRETVPYFDRIFVPSLQNQELYGRFHPDVRYLPLGVDPKVWSPVPRQMPTNEFRFLTAGKGPRKNTAQVARAFRRVFGDLLKNPDGRPLPRLIIRAVDAVPGPGIIPIQTNLSASEELSLYASAHCYVSAALAEGWGLMPNQALAQGLPTILPSAHGHAAFAHYGIPIDTHVEDAGKTTFWGDAGQWWRPDFEQMCEAMWDVYENYERHAAYAWTAAPRVGAHFNWENTARQLYLDLADHLFEDAPTERVWKPCEPRLYRIVATQDITFTINGIDHLFEAGVEKWESWDLKNMIAEQGKLRDDCIDAREMGEEAAGIARQAARDAICRTCHQRLNTNKPSLDNLPPMVEGRGLLDALKSPT